MKSIKQEWIDGWWQRVGQVVYELASRGEVLWVEQAAEVR